MSAIRAIRPAARSFLYTQTRTMSASAHLNAEGSVGSGASRPGGAVQGDAFTKREAAEENKYVRDQEKEKLRVLKEKIAAQQKHLKDLEDHVNTLSEDSSK